MIGNTILHKTFTEVGTDGISYKLEIKIDVSQITNPNQLDWDLNPVALGADVYLLRVGAESIDSWSREYDKIAEVCPIFKNICALAERWSNPELKAGTRTQSFALKAYRLGSSTKAYSYNESCDILEKVGCYNDRGYEYGSQWLLNLPPTDLLDQVKNLIEEIDKDQRSYEK
jgi:hypothetical protein